MPSKLIYVNDVLLYPGDILSVKGGKSWLSRSIKWFTRHRGEQRTWSTHTAIVGNKYDVVESNARTEGVKFDAWRKGKNYRVWRMRNLTMDARIALGREADRFADINPVYGWWKLSHQALDGLAGKILGRDVTFWRRTLGKVDPDNPICSILISMIYWNILRFRFGMHQDCPNPDNIDDFNFKNPGDWEKMVEV